MHRKIGDSLVSETCRKPDKEIHISIMKYKYAVSLCILQKIHCVSFKKTKTKTKKQKNMVRYMLENVVYNKKVMHLPASFK